MRVLLCGNDVLLRNVRLALADAGIDVTVVRGDLEDADHVVAFSLALVDVTVPQAERVCQYIQRKSEIPVVALLGAGEDGWGRVEALKVDGYLHRTATRNEIIARLKAIERRGRVHSSPVK